MEEDKTIRSNFSNSDDSKKIYVYHNWKQVSGNTQLYFDDTSLGFSSLVVGDNYTALTINEEITVDLGTRVTRLYYTFEIVEGIDVRVHIHTTFARNNSDLIISFLASQMAHQTRTNTTTLGNDAINVKFLVGNLTVTTALSKWENFAYVQEGIVSKHTIPKVLVPVASDGDETAYDNAYDNTAYDIVDSSSVNYAHVYLYGTDGNTNNDAISAKTINPMVQYNYVTVSFKYNSGGETSTSGPDVNTLRFYTATEEIWRVVPNIFGY